MPRGGTRKGAGRKPDTDLPLTPTQTNLLKDKAREQEGAIVEQLLKLATSGDKKALELVVSHLYGKPGTQDVAEKPTTIVLNCNVPRPSSDIATTSEEVVSETQQHADSEWLSWLNSSE